MDQAEVRQAEQWWAGLLAQLPGEVKGFLFGITNMVADGPVLYVAGAAVFDPFDASGDWACDPVWSPDGRFLSTATLAGCGPEAWFETLSYCMELVEAFLEPDALPEPVEAVAVGWDDGDLMTIWTRHGVTGAVAEDAEPHERFLAMLDRLIALLRNERAVRDAARSVNDKTLMFRVVVHDDGVVLDPADELKKGSVDGQVQAAEGWAVQLEDWRREVELEREATFERLLGFLSHSWGFSDFFFGWEASNAADALRAELRRALDEAGG